MRSKRAMGMKILGGIYLETVSPENASGAKRTLREQMEAFLSGMGVGDADDEEEADDEEGDGEGGGGGGSEGPKPLGSRDELMALSVKELRELLRSRGLPTDGCIEKGDFVERLLA